MDAAPDAFQQEDPLTDCLPQGVAPEVAYGVVFMLYCLYLTQPPRHAQRILLPHDLCHVLGTVAEAAVAKGAPEVARCLCVLVRCVSTHLVTLAQHNLLPYTTCCYTVLTPHRSQAFVFNAVDIPIETFSSSSVGPRYGKRDLRLPDQHFHAEAELLRHVAYHQRTALHVTPAVGALGPGHGAYVEAVERAFALQGPAGGTVSDPTAVGFASDPDFVRRLEGMLHDDAQQIASVRATFVDVHSPAGVVSMMATTWL